MKECFPEPWRGGGARKVGRGLRSEAPLFTIFKVWLVWKSQLSRLGCLVFLQVVLPISMSSMYFRPFTI